MRIDAYDRYHRPAVARATQPKQLRHVYSVRLDSVELEALNRHVRATGRSASDIFREALREYLETRA